MAKLTKQDVLKLALLSRLSLTNEELDEFSENLPQILEYVEMLQPVDTKGKKPTNQVTGLTDVMRDDVVIDYGYAPRDLLNNVPRTEADQIKVNRMIE